MAAANILPPGPGFLDASTRTREALTAAGLTATLTPDGIKVTPASRLTDDLRRLIRANKSALVEWLRAANDPETGAVKPTPHARARTHARIAQENPLVATVMGEADPGAPMTPGEVETFIARAQLFQRRGLDAGRAEGLADKLHRRDRQGDNRGICLECARLTVLRDCTAWRQAGLSSRIVAGLTSKLQHCPAFSKVEQE